MIKKAVFAFLCLVWFLLVLGWCVALPYLKK